MGENDIIDIFVGRTFPKSGGEVFGRDEKGLREILLHNCNHWVFLKSPMIKLPNLLNKNRSNGIDYF